MENKFLDCQKCLLYYSNDKLITFTCNHKICHKCSFANLLSYMSQKTNGLTENMDKSESFPCSFCKEGRSTFSINKFLHEIVAKKAFTKNILEKACSVCNNYKEIYYYCHDCKTPFCRKCFSDVHNSIIPFQKHRINEIISSELNNKIKCLCQEDRNIVFGCCGKFFCEICIVKDHLSHTFTFVKHFPISGEQINNPQKNHTSKSILEQYYQEGEEELKGRLPLRKYMLELNKLKKYLSDKFNQNKKLYTVLMNNCLYLLRELKVRYSSNNKNSSRTNYTDRANFIIFKNSYHELQKFLESYHLKFIQELIVNFVYKVFQQLEQKEDQINRIIITDFLSIAIQEEDDDENNIKDEIRDLICDQSLKKLSRPTKESSPIKGRLEKIIGEIHHYNSRTKSNNRSLVLVKKKTMTKSLGENLRQTEQTILKVKEQVLNKHIFSKYDNIEPNVLDLFKLKSTLVYQDDKMSTNSYPNQFVVLNTSEYVDCICWLNNLDYSIEVIDLDKQGWGFDQNYRTRLKRDKINLKAHCKEIISIRFFIILEKYCIITCSLDEKCRIFDCDEEFDNFLTINCGYKPNSAVMFDVYDDEEEISSGFVAVCSFSKNSPIKIYNTRTINISDGIFRTIEVEGHSYFLDLYKLSQDKVLLLNSVSEGNFYYLKIFNFSTGKQIFSIQVFNYINSIIYRNDEKDLYVIFNDRSGTLWEFNLNQGEVSRKITNVGYYGLVNYKNEYIISCGKKHSLDVIDMKTFEVVRSYQNVHSKSIRNIIYFEHETYGNGIFTYGEDKKIKILR